MFRWIFTTNILMQSRCKCHLLCSRTCWPRRALVRSWSTAHNKKVADSNPAPAIIKKPRAKRCFTFGKHASRTTLPTLCPRSVVKRCAIPVRTRIILVWGLFAGRSALSEGRSSGARYADEAGREGSSSYLAAEAALHAPAKPAHNRLFRLTPLGILLQ